MDAEVKKILMNCDNAEHEGLVTANKSFHYTVDIHAGDELLIFWKNPNEYKADQGNHL